jgi:hypothetical protein
MNRRLTIDELADRARHRLPLFAAPAEDLPEAEGYHETRSRNGRTLVVSSSAATAATPRKRDRSPREVALDSDPHHRRREAARKRALRARRRLQGRKAAPGDERLALVPWLAHVPAGPTFEVLAYSHREARRLARQFLGLARGEHLPPGTHLFPNTHG